MALMLTGRLQQADLIEAVPAVPAKDGQEERKAQPAYVELAVFDRRVKNREARTLFCKAPVEMHEFFEDQLDSTVQLLVEGYLYADNRGNGKVSYKLVAGAYEQEEDTTGK